MLTPEQIKNALDEKSAQPPDVTLLDIQKALMAENDALRASQVDAHHAHQIQALEVAQLRAENKRLREALMGISAVVEIAEYELTKAASDEFTEYKTASSLIKSATNGELSLPRIVQTLSYVRGACEKALQQEGGEREP